MEICHHLWVGLEFFGGWGEGGERWEAELWGLLAFVLLSAVPLGQVPENGNTRRRVWRQGK